MCATLNYCGDHEKSVVKKWRPKLSSAPHKTLLVRHHSLFPVFATVLFYAHHKKIWCSIPKWPCCHGCSTELSHAPHKNLVLLTTPLNARCKSFLVARIGISCIPCHSSFIRTRFNQKRLYLHIFRHKERVKRARRIFKFKSWYRPEAFPFSFNFFLLFFLLEI